jgi:putative transposase
LTTGAAAQVALSSDKAVHASSPLAKGVYCCSLRTLYRILEAEGETRERRDQLSHPSYQKPQLLATAPNQLWSWDITKLLGPVKWTYFYLYVILDVFSRYVVGWMIADREGQELARQFIAATCTKQDIAPGQLTLHADRGSSMKSKPVALMLADLGVTKTHSRPHVSDDNPFSESHFKTLKYRPEFPDRFGSLQHARAFCQDFFPWYNTEHHHSGLGLLTPEVVHSQRAEQVRNLRQQTLDVASKSPGPGSPAAHPPQPSPGAAGHGSRSGGGSFEAVVSRNAVQRRLIDELLGLFGGRTQPVMVHLIESGKLTLDDVQDAEKTLRKLAKKAAP